MNIFFNSQRKNNEWRTCLLQFASHRAVLTKEVEFLYVVRGTGVAKFSMQNSIGPMSSISLANEGCRLESKLFFCTLFKKGPILLAGAFFKQHRLHGLENDPQIHGKGEIFNIIQIIFQLAQSIFLRGAIGIKNLCPAGDTGFDIMP